VLHHPIIAPPEEVAVQPLPGLRWLEALKMSNWVTLGIDFAPAAC
jgi:hypothetical protein